MINIDGFAITPYRSFSGDLQRIGPLRKINLMIGQNNSGKSNILRFADEHMSGVVLAARSQSNYSYFKEIDRNVGSGAFGQIFSYALAVDGPAFEAQKQEWRKSFREEYLDLFDKVLWSFPLSDDGQVAWFTYEREQNGRFSLSPALVDQILEKGKLASGEWERIRGALVKGSRGGDIRRWILEVLWAISPVERDVPAVALVPAIREIQPSAGDADGFGGRGLIERLAKLQHPGHSEQSLKKQFAGINIFLREVTGSDSATIEIPDDRSTIIVHLDGRVLPLASLGTGIHEVVIMAAAATSVSGYLVCIEEPEIHLHPILQRKLLGYLDEFTDNQYLIATHSAHLMDFRGISIFHVRLDEGRSLVRSVIEAPGKFEICRDLGHKASDILQANCIIWVEGPSDRIYLKFWIRSIAAELIEGIHYSIMFYGGRLLAHLTADDPEVEDFISLRRLNRSITVLIDSDRRSATARINSTKKRVKDEFDKGPGFAWITAGREIENYVPASLIEEAIREIHRGALRVPEPGRFDETLVYFDSKQGKKKADKVKVAHRVVQMSPSLDMLDLEKRLARLVDFIREANLG